MHTHKNQEWDVGRHDWVVFCGAKPVGLIGVVPVAEPAVMQHYGAQQDIIRRHVCMHALKSEDFESILLPGKLLYEHFQHLLGSQEYLLRASVCLFFL